MDNSKDIEKEIAEINVQMAKCKSDFAKILDEFDLERYVGFKRLYSEFDITSGPFKNMEELFDVSDEMIEFGLDPLKLASVMDGDECIIDEFCVALLEKINERRRLEKEGASHIQCRRKAIPDSLIKFLIILIMESCQFHKVYPTHSLVTLLVEMLGGLNTDRRKRVKLKLRKREMAEIVAIVPDISNRALERSTGIDFTTISRWRREKEFSKYEEMYKSIHDDAEWCETKKIEFIDFQEIIDLVQSLPSSCNLDYIDVSWRFRKISQ